MKDTEESLRLLMMIPTDRDVAICPNRRIGIKHNSFGSKFLTLSRKVERTKKKGQKNKSDDKFQMCTSQVMNR